MKKNKVISIILSVGILLFVFNCFAEDGKSTNKTQSTPKGIDADWTMYQKTPSHDGQTPDKVLKPPLVQKWKFSSNIKGSAGGTMIVGNKVFVEIANHFYALDTAKGTVIWEYTGTQDFSNSPAIANGIIYVGNNDGKLYALNATNGKLITTFTTGGEVRGGTVVNKGLVYFTSWDGNIYSVTTGTLSLVWKTSISMDGIIEDTPAVTDGVIYVGGGTNLWVLDALSGATYWTRELGSAVHCAPAITKGIVFSGSQSGVFALETSNGSLIWYRSLGIINFPPVFNGDTVFIGANNGTIYALTLSTGSTLWVQSLPAGISQYMIGANGYLYISTGTGHGFAIVKMADGSYQGEIVGPDNLPVISRGVYYQGDEQGNLYAYVSKGASKKAIKSKP